MTVHIGKAYLARASHLKSVKKFPVCVSLQASWAVTYCIVTLRLIINSVGKIFSKNEKIVIFSRLVLDGSTKPHMNTRELQRSSNTFESQTSENTQEIVAVRTCLHVYLKGKAGAVVAK